MNRPRPDRDVVRTSEASNFSLSILTNFFSVALPPADDTASSETGKKHNRGEKGESINMFRGALYIFLRSYRSGMTQNRATGRLGRRGMRICRITTHTGPNSRRNEG